MSYFKVKRQVDAFDAPWGKTVRLQEVEYEGGMAMLRATIREGGRFTTVDLDAATALRWGAAMVDWAGGAEEE